jgi:ferrous iron transport protein B
MCDVALERGIRIDVEELSRRLGVPVVTCSAHRRENLDAVKQAIVQAPQQEERPPLRVFPAEFYTEVEQLRSEFGGDAPFYVLERLVLDPGGQIEREFTRRHGERLTASLATARERLRAAGCKIPMIEAKVRYAWARQTLSGVLTAPTQRLTTRSDWIDQYLTHRVTGLIVFCLVMFAVFQAIYFWAAPLMTAIEDVQGWFGDAVSELIPPGPLQSLLADGVIAGVGGVLVFLPQIVLLFLFIALLEDCGYMARAAFLMDKLMVKVGLSGKSFVPLMSSFACAVPGIMATRVIENRRDRMTTILVAPLMSCSARLPVYVLMVYAFLPPTLLFGWLPLQGTVLFAMTFFGAVVAIPVAWLLKQTLFRGETPPFVMELPTYKWPSPRLVLHRVYDRAKAFVVRAGTLIFATSVLVWAASYFPGDHTRERELAAHVEQLEAEDADESERQAAVAALNAESTRLLAESYIGRLGHAIEPAIRPLGWDWRIGIGVIASFPAREVIISTLGTIYSLGGDVDEEDTGLRSAMQAATWPDGRPVFTVPVAVSIMVFFALCAQCASTLLVIHRETNHWGWAVFTFVYMTGLAYLGAWATYQIGTALSA